MAGHTVWQREFRTLRSSIKLSVENQQSSKEKTNKSWVILFHVSCDCHVRVSAQRADAQTLTKKQRICSPATVTSTIGGEAQHQYVIRARKGQSMTCRVNQER